MELALRSIADGRIDVRPWLGERIVLKSAYRFSAFNDATTKAWSKQTDSEAAFAFNRELTCRGVALVWRRRDPLPAPPLADVRHDRSCRPVNGIGDGSLDGQPGGKADGDGGHGLQGHCDDAVLGRRAVQEADLAVYRRHGLPHCRCA